MDPVNNTPNVLYEKLPEEWNGYPINWWFQVGIQISLICDDSEMADFEKSEAIIRILFPEEIPPVEEINECINWFMNGWCHDRSPMEKEKRKLMDYNKDQWRIYADFRQIYGINLNEADLHWWEFMGMLWNMPQRQSTFIQVIEIRKKKIKSKMSKEECDAIRKAQYIYGLEDRKEKEKEYSKEELQRIDEVDQIRNRMKEKKRMESEAAGIFRK